MFSVCEVKEVGHYVVHENVAASVDALLDAPNALGTTPPARISHRWWNPDDVNALKVRFEEYKGGGASSRNKLAALSQTHNWLDWIRTLTASRE